MKTEIIKNEEFEFMKICEAYEHKYPRTSPKYAFIDGADYQLKQNKKIIENIVIVMEKLLKEARQNSFNANGNLNDTPTEEIAQNLINELKKY